jgi:hypothetical protein
MCSNHFDSNTSKVGAMELYLVNILGTAWNTVVVSQAATGNGSVPLAASAQYVFVASNSVSSS